jgi:hypothetical protein
MPTSHVVLLILLGLLVPAQAQQLYFWGEELKPVLGVLQEAHLSGSIGLAGRCDPSHLPGFPQFANAAASVSSPLAALREIAASDSGMRVKQDANGTIRMTEKGVPSDILNVRISHIDFEDYSHHEIHSANLAVRLILSAPEVKSFMARHNIAAPQVTGPWGSGTGPGESRWPPNAPHISGSLDNITVLEALDRVLSAFPGEAFVYWNCPQTAERNHRSRKRLRDRQQAESSFFSDCPASPLGDMQSGTVLPAGVPNPFCMRLPLSGLSRLFPTPEEPSHQRRIFIFFFAMENGFAGKTLIVGG